MCKKFKIINIMGLPSLLIPLSPPALSQFWFLRSKANPVYNIPVCTVTGICNQSQVPFTKDFTPWELVWMTEKPIYKEAVKLEQKLKNLKSKKRIRAFIEKYNR